MNVQDQVVEKKYFSEAVYRYNCILKEQISINYEIVKTFTRDLKIHNLGQNGNSTHFFIICVKYNFSDEENSDVVLLKKLSYLWDEIEVLVDKENTIVKVLNLSELLLRWMNIKNNLSKDYKGNVIESYFNSIDELLIDEKEVCDFLNTYKMFGLLFNGQYGGYDNSGKKTRVISEDKSQVIESLTLIKNENASKVKTGILEKEQTNFENYDGVFIYENDHLTEALLNFEKTDKHTKYSLLWIG